MTEPAPPDSPTPDAEETRIHSLDSLTSKIDRLSEAVAGLLGSGKKTAGDSDDGEKGSVAEEVKRELAKLKAAEDRKKAAEAHGQRVDELEAKVKAIAEKPPKEYRRITERMWGGGEK